MPGDLLGTRFSRAAIISGLVTQTQLLSIATELIASNPPNPVSELDFAKTVVSQGLLTQYQAEQLRAGRAKLTLGPYVVTDWLGQGGMGQVFKAVHPMMGRDVAIKVLPQSKSTDAAIEDFRREIRMQAQLDHPHLVRANDAGHDGNVYFLVTEFVEGTDLRRLVKTYGKLTMQQAADIIRQAAEALAYVHERGLVHRDVKPGNILVSPSGFAKLADLGLSGFLHEEDPRWGKIVGTADYLAPEQVRQAGSFSPLGDVYSLGCTFYYAVTGKVPFPGGSSREKIRRHLEDTPWHPRRFNPDLSNDFVDLLADMMEKDPLRRVQRAADVVARLQPWCRTAPKLSTATVEVKNPWHPPPFPGGTDDTSADLPIVHDESNSFAEPSGIGLQSTIRASTAAQDTVRPAPPVPVLQPTIRARKRRTPWKLLAVTIPISMLAGAALMWLWMAQRN